MGTVRQAFAMLFVTTTVMLAEPAAADDPETCRVESGDVAIAACTRAIESGKYRGKDLSAIYGNRCAEYNKRNDNDRVLADCQESSRLNPQNFVPFINLGHYYFRLGSYDRAFANYDTSVRINPKAAAGLYGRGMTKLKKGDVDGGNADIAAAKAILADIAEWGAKYGVKP